MEVGIAGLQKVALTSHHRKQPSHFSLETELRSNLIFVAMELANEDGALYQVY